MRLINATIAASSVLLASCNAVQKLTDAVGGGTCNGPATIAASQSVSGKTAGQGCKSPDGNYASLYNFTATQPTALEVTVTPSGFQPWLGAFTSGGARIGQINTTPWRLRMFVAAGSYQFGVAPVGSSDGTFTIATGPADVAGCLAGPGGSQAYADAGIAMKGAMVTGAVNNADCGNGSVRADSYNIFGATAGSSLTFTITADRAVNLSVVSNGQSLALKSLSAAGTTTVTVTSPGSDLGFAVYGTPGTGTINYTVTIS